MKSVMVFWDAKLSARVKDISLADLQKIYNNSNSMLPVTDTNGGKKPLFLAKDAVGFVELKGVTSQRKILMEIFFSDTIWDSYFDYQKSVHSEGQLFLSEAVGGGYIYPLLLSEPDTAEVTKFEAVCLVHSDCLETALKYAAQNHERITSVQKELALDAEDLKY